MPPRRRRRRSTPTPAQIWRILNATAREARSARREREEMARQLVAEAAQRQREREEMTRRLAREAAQREEVARQLAAEAAQRRKLAAEREERYRQADDRRKEEEAFTRKLQEKNEGRNRKLEREMYRLYGEGDNRWGKLIEALVEANLLTLLQDAGIEVEHALSRRRSRIRGIRREYDLVAVGDSDAVVVEVKTTLRTADVARFTERIGSFREWRWDDARERVWGALAYLTSEGDAAQTAEDAGFYLIRAVSGTARLVNSEEFKPRIF